MPIVIYSSIADPLVTSKEYAHIVNYILIRRKLTNINDADTWDAILYMEEPTFNLHEDLPESEAIEHKCENKIDTFQRKTSDVYIATALLK